MPPEELKNQDITNADNVASADQNSNEVAVSEEEKQLLDKIFGEDDVQATETPSNLENKDEQQAPENNGPAYPTQRDDESDVVYETRLKLWHLTNDKNQAETEEEEQFFKARLKEERQNLKELNLKERLEKKQSSPTIETETPDTDGGYDDEELKKAEEVLTSKLGMVKREDVKQLIAEALGQSIAQNNQKEISSIMKDFYSKNPIYSQKEVRAVFEDFVDRTFNVSSKISDKNIVKELPKYLKFADDQLFGNIKPDVQKVREANEKASIANVSSTNGGKTSYKYVPVGATDEEMEKWAAEGLI